VDFIYQDPPLVIEVDSYEYHSSRRAWQNDLTRQNALVADGRRILRFTHQDIERRPSEVIALIRTFFGHELPENGSR
jgi:very-short-patch-repair endonuclease